MIRQFIVSFSSKNTSKLSAEAECGFLIRIKVNVLFDLASEKDFFGLRQAISVPMFPALVDLVLGTGTGPYHSTF